jgi:hypothetical protein
MRRVAIALVVAGLLLAIVYLSEDLFLRYRMAHRNAGDPQTELCVRSLFPHLGHSPCWYVSRRTVKIIGGERPGKQRVALDRDAGGSVLISGEWIGRWKSTTGSSDHIYLTVDTVEGDQVRGSIFMAVATPGLGYYNRDIPFSGVFDGTELRFWVPPALWLSLKIVGTHMHGSVQSQQVFGTVELDKQQ